ncbi:MAG: hypothetical protein NVSMB39_2350 [Candidatus Saccharimonadales bacterium]
MSRSRTIVGIIAGAAALLLLMPVIFIGVIGGGVAVIGGAISAFADICQSASTNLRPLPGGSPITSKGPLLTAFQAEFARNPDYAAIVKAQDETIIPAIISIGEQKGISKRGQAIAVAVAAQETGIRNMDGGDRDSGGVFQFRPGIVNRNGVPYWGTREQVRDVTYATNRFYDEMLKKVSKAGIESLPMIQVGMMIQGPDPSAYRSRWRWDDLGMEIAQLNVGKPSDSANIHTASSQTLAHPTIACMKVPPTNVSAAVESMRSQIGKPYIWDKDEENGFDGSGLTAWAYGKIGESLPLGATAQQQSQKGVDKSELIPGDLVYLERPTSAGDKGTEVDMWMGNEQIAAATGRNQTILLSPVPWGLIKAATRPITDPKPLATVIGSHGSHKGSAIFGDDYPLGKGSIDVASPYHYLTRECVDFVSFRLNQQVGITSGPYKFGGYGNANTWKDRLQAEGYAADDTPAVGAVAWWGSNVGDPSVMRAYENGHVAIVSAVYVDGSITVEQYNASGIGNGAYGYSSMVLQPSYWHALKFLHVADIANPPQIT